LVETFEETVASPNEGASMDGRITSVQSYSTTPASPAAFALLPAGCGRCMPGAGLWTSDWSAIYEQAWRAAVAAVQSKQRTRYQHALRIHLN
jgi:hypothetical protein